MFSTHELPHMITARELLCSLALLEDIFQKLVYSLEYVFALLMLKAIHFGWRLSLPSWCLFYYHDAHSLYMFSITTRQKDFSHVHSLTLWHCNQSILSVPYCMCSRWECIPIYLCTWVARQWVKNLMREKPLIFIGPYLILSATRWPIL